ncbi:MAG: ribonuclease P protein component [Endomicrobium sp.]|jgi:ribonuclease P protein component|nr:ribonuclease P protein component [Endomicrobium sp.]
MQIKQKETFSTGLSNDKSVKRKFSFSYFERLHIQRDFNKVFKNGLRLENKAIRILAYIRKDGQDVRRLGLITPKRVGTAVIRNRIKRRVREIFRTNKHLLEPSLDLIFILKTETVLLDYKKLEDIILVLLKDANLYVLSE